MVMILIARLLASDWFNGAFGPFDPTISPLYWNAAAIGALGALFSIALQIRSREVPIDLFEVCPNPADSVELRRSSWPQPNVGAPATTLGKPVT